MLKKLDEVSAPVTAQPPVAPLPPAPTIVEERVELPPLDFKTGRPVDAKPAALHAVADKAAEKPKRAIESVTVLEDAARQRVRDAYVTARFSGLARSSQDLARVRAVVRAAQIYLEDGNQRRAEELLELATELQPVSEALPLARLELALRVADSEGYRRVALRFRKDHPRSARWKEIVAFARTLYLTEAPFTPDASDSGDRAYLRPNWLQDAWELTPEFMPGDLRARVLAVRNDPNDPNDPNELREKEAA